MIKLAITGACGRMGQRLVAISSQDKEFKLVAAIDKPDCAIGERMRGDRGNWACRGAGYV